MPNNIIKRSKEVLEELENNFSKEAHKPQLTGKLEQNQKHKQLLLFEQQNEQNAIIEKIKKINVNNLTPIKAINLLNEIKNEIDNPK